MLLSWNNFWLLLLTAQWSRPVECSSTETPSSLLPLEARSADLSEEEDVISTSYVLPNQIFNDGKPYYARQDPVSGQLDFSDKKPASIEPEANEVIDPKEKIVLSAGAQNIHDYLNLPVKYSSSKFVYPLVSSSYANLKYQGSNKNYITNKSPTSVVATERPTTTRLMAVPSTVAASFPPVYAPTTTTTTTTTTLKTTTTQRPAPTVSTTKTATSTTQRRPPSSPATTTTLAPLPPRTTQRRLSPSTTTQAPLPPRTSTTRKKFIPKRKNPPPATAPIKPPTTPRPTPGSSTSTLPFTTHHPTPQAPIFPTEQPKFTKMYTTPITRPPVVFTEEPTLPPITPMPANAGIPNLSPADVYHTLEQKNQIQQQQQKPMTLGEIFNSLVEEESAVAQNYPPNQGFDAQGNLIVPLAPSKPSPFAVQPPNSSFHPQPPQTQTYNNNEYVSYQVQQPNLMQYRPGPVPSHVKNVVLSPGQQATSFVLGSQSVVGENVPHYGSVQKEALVRPQQPAINYNADGSQEPPPEPPSPYQQLPLIGSINKPPPTAVRPEQPSVKPTQFPTPDSSASDTKDLLVSTNIRFPANDGESEELTSSAMVPGTASDLQINGHAQPLSLQQIQNANPVVFPPIHDEENPLKPNVQIQQHSVLPMKQYLLSQPGIRKDQRPSQNMEPPAQYPTKHHLNQPQPQPQPQPPRGDSPAPPYPHYPQRNELVYKADSGPIGRPGNNLPNILPQFRPNVKMAHEHPHPPPPGYRQDPGMKKPYLAAPSPQFTHRRQSLHSKHIPKNRISQHPIGPPPPPGAVDINRRVYRLPHPYGNPGMDYAPSRLYAGPNRVVDRYLVERHAPIGNDPYKTIRSEALNGFEEDDLVINDPPEPVTGLKDRKNDETKLEPVITLQMMQTQKKAVSLPSEDSGVGEIQVTAENDPEAPSLPDQSADPQQVYAAYSQPQLNNTREPQSPQSPQSPHVEVPSGSEYQNTPFSVIRDQPQEPILKNRKAESLQQKQKAQMVIKERFPYPIEKPDLSFMKVQKSGGGNIIHSSMGGGTETPIAIAYSPTEQSPHYSTINGRETNFEINEKSVNSQTANGEIDLGHHSFEKDFMAPFFPSVNLETAASDPQQNNWKIAPSVSNDSIYDKLKINRADVESDNEKEDEESKSSVEKTFEHDSFQPELQGGFKPIYPPGYSFMDLESEQKKAPSPSPAKPEDKGNNEENLLPQAQALISTSPEPERSESSTTSSTVAPPETQSPSSSATLLDRADDAPKLDATKATAAPQKKKSTFETSLSALLFGTADEFEKSRDNVDVAKAKVGPRNVPRMGPRNLKLR